jgi:hypothetical protein
MGSINGWFLLKGKLACVGDTTGSSNSTTLIRDALDD